MSGIIEHLSQHHDHLLYTIAAICLLLEMSVIGMSGPLLFLALACLITGIANSVGIVSTWQVEVALVGVLSVSMAIVLWKPFKRFQNSDEVPNTSSDMIGRRLPVSHSINRSEGRITYSGIEWQARLQSSAVDTIPASAYAEVVSVDGSLLIVKPC